MKKKKKHINKKTRQKLSKALKKYWQSYEGKHRKHEFFQVPTGKGKEYRKKQEAFKGQHGEYKVVLMRRQEPRGGYKTIPLEEFKKGKKYLVYIVHKKSRQSRLLASGVLYDLPVATKKQTQDWFRPVISSSRRFKPLKFKKRGKWISIKKFYQRAIENIDSQAENLRKLGKGEYKIRGAMLPLKRYYNPELMIFSDEPIPRARMIKEAFAHVVTTYDYPHMKWISARHVKLEFKGKGIRVDELASKLSEIEDLAEDALRLEHKKGNIKVMMVDGFIPVKFSNLEKKRKKRKKK